MRVHGGACKSARTVFPVSLARTASLPAPYGSAAVSRDVSHAHVELETQCSGEQTCGSGIWSARLLHAYSSARHLPRAVADEAGTVKHCRRYDGGVHVRPRRHDAVPRI